LEWCCCLSFSFQESCFRECYFENSIGQKQFDVKTFFKMRHQSRMPSLLMVLLYFEYDEATIQNRMELLYPCRNALESQNGINNCIIDDSYSSDQSKNSMDFSRKSKQYKKKTVILSDIFKVVCLRTSCMIKWQIWLLLIKLIVSSDWWNHFGIQN
jgi:alanine racemase